MVEIISYDPKYAADFKALNLEWLDKFGLTEAADLAMLDNPEDEIINPGGFIYLAKSGDIIIGAAALIKENETSFELAKMVVAPAFQGQGISKRLLESCVTKAKEQGANRIFLLSNSQLKTALSLYEKMGFKYIPVTGSHYQSADIMMELFL